jgi:signal peptidase I
MGTGWCFDMVEEKEQLKEKPQTDQNKTSKKAPHPAWLWTRDIVICLILVLLFRANVAEANYIPSVSMEPTLHQNDRIIVEKLSMNWRPLERGDVVVFHPPIQGHERERWIKRVIALPGETVEVIRGKIYIDGAPLEEPYIADPPAYNYPVTRLAADDPSTSQNEGEYFLLGDNRRDSRDSHVWGACPASEIIGRAIFRYWPISKVGGIETAETAPHIEE